MYKAK